MADEAPSDLVEGLAALLRSQDGAVSADRDVAERERLVHALARTSKRGVQAPARRWWLAGAAAAAAAAALVLAWPADDLEFTVEGAELAEEGYVRAESGEARVAFSDGSSITLTRGTVARVAGVDDSGARVLLEDGELRVKVTPRAGARWSVAAGPFSVAVTGTAFDAAWDADRQRVEIALHEGSVRVRGPMVRDGVVMRPGQRLVARVPERELALGDGISADGSQAGSSDGDDPSAPEAPSARAASPENTGGPASESDRAPAEPVPRVPWSKRIADGEFEIVLAEAEARGVETVLASAPMGDVMALADAARYKGRAGLARRALESVRTRFGGSEAAHTAAFLLGRMSEGAPSSAIAWYDRYLAEAPGGTFAAEALGRKMALLSSSGQRARAREVAESYLRAYPKGAYAGLARQLTGR